MYDVRLCHLWVTHCIHSHVLRCHLHQLEIPGCPKLTRVRPAMWMCWCIAEASEYIRSLLARGLIGPVNPPGGLQEPSTGLSEPGLDSSTAQLVSAQLICLRRCCCPEKPGAGLAPADCFCPPKAELLASSLFCLSHLKPVCPLPTRWLRR